METAIQISDTGTEDIHTHRRVLALFARSHHLDLRAWAEERLESDDPLSALLAMPPLPLDQVGDCLAAMAHPDRLGATEEILRFHSERVKVTSSRWGRSRLTKSPAASRSWEVGND
ncbi:MAG: hypothetical protein H6Q00_1650 [Holophagaceae bacterium]|nr:hypothetical protein [Holophagaceae bacterium]